MPRSSGRSWPTPGRILGVLLCLLPAAPLPAQVPPDLQLVEVASGLGRPVAVRHAGDGSARLFVVDVDGRIRVIRNGSVLATPFLAIDGSSAPPPYGFGLGGEGGLLGLAFHPQFEANGRVYVYYTDAQSDGVLARYTVLPGNPDRLDPASVQVLLRIDSDTTYHKGGDLHFGPDGYLYLSVGDGGGGISLDTCNRAQSLSPADLAANDGNDPDCPADAGFTGTGGNPDSRALQGKLLRIDIDAATPAGGNELCAAAANGSAGYAIPADNPFAGTAGGPGRCDEIWAYGLRNPYRFSFDRHTGDLLVGEVGEGEREEINWLRAGQGGHNFGWPMCEGSLGNCPGTVAPVLEYSHTANGAPCSSVTGGYRYRGAINGLRGLYVASDYCTGRLRYARRGSAGWQFVQTGAAGPFLEHAGFGEGEDGALYLALIESGKLLRFSATGQDGLFGYGFD
ncbi:MAG: PQQ-dependent sugar dehydrogenase [Pseudoxanthomonas sp.]|nr:PQQ-dependent sugar dehydrogenase [Pseudoxanthomonas sp.]